MMLAAAKCRDDSYFDAIFHRVVERERVDLSVDGERQLWTQPAFGDDSVVKAGTARIEGAEDFANRNAGDLELRSAGAKVAQGGRDNNEDHG